MEGSGLSKGHVKRIFDFAGDPRENGSVLQSSARGHGDRDVMLQGRDWVSRPSEMPTTPSLTVLPDLAGVQWQQQHELPLAKANIAMARPKFCRSARDGTFIPQSQLGHACTPFKPRLRSQTKPK